MGLSTYAASASLEFHFTGAADTSRPATTRAKSMPVLIFIVLYNRKDRDVAVQQGKESIPLL